MEQFVLFGIVTLIALGITSQWLAWRFQLPAIVIMSIAGLLIGPFLGILNPEQALGDFYIPVISLAVALILFEGSSSLDIRELRGISKSVIRIVTIGAFLAWIGGSLAAHYIAGLQWETSFVIGGLFIVTGPTVIIPLLRQAKLKPRTAAVLKWEGIIVDPFGALVALFAYQIVKVITNDAIGISYIFSFFLGAIFAALLGYIFALTISMMIEKGKIPEYLKTPIILSFVLLCFGISEMMMHETGLLAVTVMGLTIARLSKYISALGDIRHFNEDISVLLTSTIFIMLTASLPMSTIKEIFSLPIISFIVIMLFLVRPASIWISTIGTELSLAEKTLIGWIAPRGIVALTVSGYFASILTEDGYYSDAKIFTTITFALVIVTVCAHGFSIGFLSRKLGLANKHSPGVLLVGSSKFSIELAVFFKEKGIPTLIVDRVFDHIIEAKSRDVDTYYGEILSKNTQFNVDMNSYEYILALDDSVPYNALIHNMYLPIFGHQNCLALTINTEEHVMEQLYSPAIKSYLLFGEKESYQELNRKIESGYTFKNIEMKENKIIKREDRSNLELNICVIKKSGKITFATLKKDLVAEAGDQLVILSKNE
ncbi:cation:proton antiporter [Chengkuizengella marina]|uniref:Sodium:proton antiporter n=1 Tax=Chengkuizengella marina TaxID=2507566 RepID=A0A6N9PX92_9BACL|nr:sodium:proton antiporter [Chengkuizengella marina]NBI28121.1 sodium:proton antiporter [Chengkuizengella marina]